MPKKSPAQHRSEDFHHHMSMLTMVAVVAIVAIIVMGAVVKFNMEKKATSVETTSDAGNVVGQAGIVHQPTASISGNDYGKMPGNIDECRRLCLQALNNCWGNCHSPEDCISCRDAYNVCYLGCDHFPYPGSMEGRGYY
jgi:hypothetical protein